jgi:oxaloacetate decarboxylase gamma subunit
MNISEQLEQAVNLMFLGMGMVFFILSLLIVSLKIVSAIIIRYEPLHVNPQVLKNGSGKINTDVIEAISIAMKRYRSK